MDEDVSPWADAGVEPDAGRPADEAERRQSVASADCGHPDERRWGPLLRSGSFLRGAPGGVRYLAALVWLLFVIFPVLNAIGKHGSPLSHGLIIGGAALFVATYATLVMRWRSGESPRVSLALTVLLLALATGLTLTQASGWGFLFTYCAACVAILAPRGAGFYGVALCSILAAVTSAIAGADGGTVLGFVASSAGIGAPSKFPAHTATVTSWLNPTVQLSRKPFEVPVFAATGNGNASAPPTPNSAERDKSSAKISVRSAVTRGS